MKLLVLTLSSRYPGSDTAPVADDSFRPLRWWCRKSKVLLRQSAPISSSAAWNALRLENALLVVLQLDTPGGLDTSMRQIIRGIPAAHPCPWRPSWRQVGPGQQVPALISCMQAISQRWHRAPIWAAATPVEIGGLPEPEPKPEPGPETRPKPSQNSSANQADETGEPGYRERRQAPRKDAMSRKIVHDAAAYIRALAQMRKRNVEWAERAVREAVSHRRPTP